MTSLANAAPQTPSWACNQLSPNRTRGHEERETNLFATASRSVQGTACIVVFRSTLRGKSAWLSAVSSEVFHSCPTRADQLHRRLPRGQRRDTRLGSRLLRPQHDWPLRSAFDQRSRNLLHPVVEIVAFVVDHDERRKIFDLDFPDGFMPSSGNSRTSTLRMQSWARRAAGPPTEPR